MEGTPYNEPVESPTCTAEHLEKDVERCQAAYEEASATFLGLIDEIALPFPRPDLHLQMKEAAKRFKETRGAYMLALRRFNESAFIGTLSPQKLKDRKIG